MTAVRPRVGGSARIGAGVLAVAVIVGGAVIAAAWGVGSGVGSPSASPSGGLDEPSSTPVAPSGAEALPGRLAFTASQVIGDVERWQLYVVDAAGGEWDRMTELTDRVSLAAWSPDGRQLVYTLQGDENLPPRVVTVADAPAWTQRPWPSTTDVVEWRGDVYALESVDWSPTDELIVEGFPGERAGPNRIFAVSPDGSAVRLVTEPDPDTQRGTVMDRRPSVSPDGGTVVFYSGPGPGTTSVWAAGADGTGRIEVTDQVEPYVGSLAEQAATGASWSPDGARLVLGARTGPLGPADIWTMRAQGTDLRRLNHDVYIDDRPAWSPDGGWIAWTRTESGRREIWVMTADGGEARPLVVGDEGEDLDLVGWAPDPEAS